MKMTAIKCGDEGNVFALVNEGDEEAASFHINRHREDFGEGCSISFEEVSFPN
jgi:hypothetical protein